MAIIYRVTNCSNGKMYIGQTKHSLEYRRKTHFRNLKWKKNRLFANALRKYGEDTFKWEVIMECSEHELNQWEIHFIDVYRTYIGFEDCCGYNMTLGGSMSDTLSNNPRREQIIEQIRDTLKEKCNTPEMKKMYSERNKWSDERRSKYLEANHRWSEECRTKHKEMYIHKPHPLSGRARSLETRQKISIAVKANPPRLFGEANPMYGKTGALHPKYGTKITEETRQKLSKPHMFKDKDSFRQICSGNSSGAKNPNAKSYSITSPNNETFIVMGGLQSFCSQHNLSFVMVKHHVGKGCVVATKTNQKSEASRNTVGWSIEEVMSVPIQTE